MVYLELPITEMQLRSWLSVQFISTRLFVYPTSCLIWIFEKEKLTFLVSPMDGVNSLCLQIVISSHPDAASFPDLLPRLSPSCRKKTFLLFLFISPSDCSASSPIMMLANKCSRIKGVRPQIEHLKTYWRKSKNQIKNKNKGLGTQSTQH